MKNYFLNLKLWYQGFSRFPEITDWKLGWQGTFKWKALYATDYLAGCLIFAGPVTSVSRYVNDHWFSLGIHGAHAGPDLWGTVRSPPWVRVGIPLAWVGILWFLI